MFQLVRSMDELDVHKLQLVYEQSIQISGLQFYPNESENMRILLAQQDFYSDLILYFNKYSCLYALWVSDGDYKAATRLEKYSDGYLLVGLETAPSVRCRGYATKLLHSILENALQAGIKRLYSHVERRNIPSVAVHLKCGFRKISDHAIFLDGSISGAYDTYLYEINDRL